MSGVRWCPASTRAPGWWSWPGGLGADADLRVADLAEPLPFPDDAFDDVVASLVLHYLEDWKPVLAELRRVLRTGGRLIASVNHPFMVNLTHRQDAGPGPTTSSSTPGPTNSRCTAGPRG